MKTIKIEAYEVIECFDRDIGPIGYFETAELAKQFIDCMPDSCYRSVSKFSKTYNIQDNLDEATGNTKKKLIESAKSKLTPEELVALGL